MNSSNGLYISQDRRQELTGALFRLDALLSNACRVASEAYNSGQDRFRGLYINKEEVARLLGRAPLSPPFQWDEDSNSLLQGAHSENSPFALLGKKFGLSDFDLDVLLMVLAPEIDIRYEKIYAYLQDDVTRKRPTLDLVLNVLTSSLELRLECLTHFASPSPLIDHGILLFGNSPEHTRGSWLSSELQIDESVVRYLLGEQMPADPLKHFSTWVKVDQDQNPWNDVPKNRQFENARRAYQSKCGLHLHLYGAEKRVRKEYAMEMAQYVGAPLLIVHMPSVLEGSKDIRKTLRRMFLHCRLWDATVLLDDLDSVVESGSGYIFRQIQQMLACWKGISWTTASAPWLGTEYPHRAPIQVEVEWPAYRQRTLSWRAQLERAGVDLKDDEIATLAGRFRISDSGIEAAVATACAEAGWQLDPEASPPRQAEFSKAVRTQSGQELSALARTITPRYSWGDIILPAETKRQLEEICYRVKHRHRVFEDWGFGTRLSLGKGVNALFAGPSGTGKTMAAEVIALELGLDLYQIDLSGVVSKYIGETEKNLDRVFTAARNANAILFFDEADALFGKRSEVKDAHDRYANIEVSYLLQKMEEYEGLAILATNLRQNLDEAFLRRLAFVVHFPFPDENYRLAIWQKIWPAETPLAADLDLEFFAHRFKLSGGNIKNAALAAAFFAVEDSGIVTMEHLLKAMQREFQKMGKTLSEGDLAYEPWFKSSKINSQPSIVNGIHRSAIDR